MTPWHQTLQHNIEQVRMRIASACRRAGRQPTEVCLVGVTKYVSPEVLAALLEAGLVDIGESRVQQLSQRAAAFAPGRRDWPFEAPPRSGPPPRWHMIGHLQRNKVNAFLECAHILHSLDSIRLARAIEQRAAESGTLVDGFIEVNVAGEQSKQGLAPPEVNSLAGALADCPHIRLRGLMTMAPYHPNPEAARPHFVALRELLERLHDAGRVGPDCCHLSMGMSQDYAVAVEEGATLVRVGSALFEGLDTSDPRA